MSFFSSFAKNIFKQSSQGGIIKDNSDQTPASVSHYWQMDPPSRVEFTNTVGATAILGGHGPAPRLNPVTWAGKSSSSEMLPSTHINIRDSHHWTESPRSSRREVPMLNLKEMSMVTNPMLNQIANNTFAFAGGVGQIKDAASGFVNAFKEGFKQLKDGLPTEEQAKKMKDAFDKNRANVIRSGMKQSEFVDPMSPYDILYTTLDTGFKYTLPFLEDNYMSHINDFGDATVNYSGGGIMAGVASAMSGLTKATASLNLDKVIAPGRLIEQPKAFTFTGREKSYTVKFPLLNTMSYADIVRNWQFLFLLSYQNTPNRINRDMIDPPCIYESLIPGVWYSKYSAITDLTVDFVGARREMGVEIKYRDVYSSGGGTAPAVSKEVVTVIPDAYLVSITVKELFAETQNFKYRMLGESMQDRITTGDLQYDLDNS